jgi:hypothetical protein
MPAMREVAVLVAPGCRTASPFRALSCEALVGAYQTTSPSFSALISVRTSSRGSRAWSAPARRECTNSPTSRFLVGRYITLSGMRAASARQPISMELKCADNSSTPRPVACAAFRCSSPVMQVMCRMRSFDDHQLMAVSNSAQPRPAKCSRRMAIARLPAPVRAARSLEVAPRDALGKWWETGTEQPEPADQ